MDLRPQISLLILGEDADPDLSVREETAFQSDVLSERLP